MIHRQLPNARWKVCGWLLTTAILLAPPVQAGRIEQSDDKTIIHVKLFGLPDPANTSTQSRAAVAGIRLFVKRFPEIFAERYRDKYKADPDKYGDYNWDHVEIKLERFSGLSLEGHVETDLLAIAADLAPDVLYVNFRKSNTYVENGFLYPLDKPEDGYMSDMSQHEKDLRIHDAIWPVITRVGPEKKEHVYAMPYEGALGKVLLYRRDLFEEHDIPFPDKHWTWDDLYEAARKITDPSKDRYGLILRRGVWESWYWVTFLWSAGGEVMEYKRETDEWRCTFDSRAAALALDYYIKLSAEPWIDKAGKKRRGYSTKDASEEAGTRWIEGKVGMFFAYIEEKLLQTINPDVVGMAPVPLGPPDEKGRRIRGAELNSRMMGLFSQIKHPAVRDAAWEYIRFYDSEEALKVKTRIMVEGGLGRFVHPKYLRRFGYKQLVHLSPKGWAETFDIAIDTGKPEPYGRGSNLAYNMMTYPIQEAEQMMLDETLPEDDQARLDLLQSILKRWNTKANEKMIGIIPPKERSLRRITAWLFLAIIVVVFVWVFRKIFRTFSADIGLEESKTRWRFRKYWLAYLLLVPAVLTILIWQYMPLARGSIMAFQDYNVLGTSTWVWVDNFGDLLWDIDEHGWWDSVWNSVRFSLLVVGLTFLPPIALAILLQEVPVGTLFFRTIFYLPAVITGLVTMLLWKMFYTPTEFGILNQVVMIIPAIAYLILGLILLAVSLAFARRLWFHESTLPAVLSAIAGLVLLYTCAKLAGPILFPGNETVVEMIRRFPMRLFSTQDEPYRWLSDRNTAMLACVIPMVWAGIGPGCLIYLAALKGIAHDFYEASDIDGATFIDKILFVVFPIIKPLVVINFVGVFIGSWQSSANILAMTGGAADTEVADLKIFFEAFTFLKMGPATAMAWVLGFMLVGFTVYQLRILSRLEFRTTGK